ncbi:LLM class flavin-dependent oxidoreductase [Actinacidiphila acididurans]|uniref:LLM class flavin-dependent oxidoreductase n=1 Tax=Actinacidiphila acididurans TaxID=2784346 RepID=UPI001F18F692|nr:LLM class flavin-dependent oxidoreductase [Actinacidiphila acididurans]
MRRARALHLAAAIDGGTPFDASHVVDLARLAESGALDFVTLGLPEQGSGGPGPAGPDALDALAALARVAPATDRIGLVPAVSVPSAGTEPFEVALAVATLDWVSRGRAGWTLAVPADDPGGNGSGVRTDTDKGTRRMRGGTAAARRRAAERVAERAAERAAFRWRNAARTAAALARAWEDGGPLPGASARPVTAVDATEPAARPVAARHADLVLVRATGPEEAAAVAAEVRRLVAEAGRDPDRLLVLGELRVDLGGGELGAETGAEAAPTSDGADGVLFRGGPVDLADLVTRWHRSGAVDGFHIRPVRPLRDLERFVNGTVALLQHRGLFRSFHPGTALRDHLGLRGTPGRAEEGAAVTASDANPAVAANGAGPDRLAVTGGTAS